MQNWKLLVYIHLRQLLLPIMMLNEASQTSNTQESLKFDLFINVLSEEFLFKPRIQTALCFL